EREERRRKKREMKNAESMENVSKAGGAAKAETEGGLDDLISAIRTGKAFSDRENLQSTPPRQKRVPGHHGHGDEKEKKKGEEKSVDGVKKDDVRKSMTPPPPVPPHRDGSPTKSSGVKESSGERTKLTAAASGVVSPERTASPERMDGFEKKVTKRDISPSKSGSEPKKKAT
ncbi:hypothetical protein HK098_005776, partial [Nowakowskiella sp. JEL0407]